MKLSVFTVPLYSMSADEAFGYLASLGVEQVEIGAGGYPGTGHLNPADYLNNDAAVAEYKAMMKRHSLTISALSCHGNPVHPNAEIAKKFHDEFVDTCKVAQKFDVDTVVAFSGCPGDCAQSMRPNWVTCQWPGDFTEILDWQWNEVLIPYWKKTVEIARSYGVTKIAFEMHPGFCVYNPASLLRLRDAVGDIVGVNFDPSHLIWQGMDPVAALRELKGAVYHFHAKDTLVDKYNTAKNGVLDTRSFASLADRSWAFRTVGYGSDAKLWRDIISTLRLLDYDGAISIEHEDGLMSPREGLEKAVTFLQDILIREQPSAMWWA